VAMKSALPGICYNVGEAGHALVELTHYLNGGLQPQGADKWEGSVLQPMGSTAGEK